MLCYYACATLLTLFAEKKCYWLLMIELVSEGEKSNSSLINIYVHLLAKMLSSSCLFYGIHCTTVLWGHSTCLAGGM